MQNEEMKNEKGGMSNAVRFAFFAFCPLH